MLDVDRREHVDPGLEHVLDVLVALLVLDARGVGVRELVDQAQLGIAAQRSRAGPSPRAPCRGSERAGAGRPRARRPGRASRRGRAARGSRSRRRGPLRPRPAPPAASGRSCRRRPPSRGRSCSGRGGLDRCSNVGHARGGPAYALLADADQVLAPNITVSPARRARRRRPAVRPSAHRG